MKLPWNFEYWWPRFYTNSYVYVRVRVRVLKCICMQ